MKREIARIGAVDVAEWSIPFRRHLTARLTPLAVGSTSTPSSINLLVSHFHAAAKAPIRPLPRRL